MTSSELYLKPGDVKKTQQFLTKLQTNKQRPKDGLAELCGIVAAKMGDYWDAQGLLYAFYGQMLRKHKVAERLIASANEFVARKYLNANHLNYNDLDDDLWADISEGVDKTMLPDFESGDFAKQKECSFFWTKYTIYHESHGHAFIFFLKHNHFDNEGKRYFTSAELHFRKIDEDADKFRKQKPAKLWKDFVVYGDSRDKGFVLSANLQRGDEDTLHAAKLEPSTECEATLWAGNLFQELQHFDAVIADPPDKD